MEALTKTSDPEVLGIVISNGPRAETEPRFAAYVWAPAPDEDPEPSAPAR